MIRSCWSEGGTVVTDDGFEDSYNGFFSRGNLSRWMMTSAVAVMVVMAPGSRVARWRALRCLRWASALSAGLRRVVWMWLWVASSGQGLVPLTGVCFPLGFMEAVMRGEEITVMGQRKYPIELRGSCHEAGSGGSGGS